MIVMIASYPHLRGRIKDKKRGRKNEVQVLTGPDLWAHMPLGFDRDIHIYLDSSRATVCTIHPDNSMEVDIHRWHTPLSCRIIEALTGHNAWTHKGTIWHRWMPVDGPICYSTERQFIEPPKYVKINNEVFARLEQVTLADLPPKERLMKELGTWNPSPAVTDRVKAYARGEIEKDRLGARDILTVCSVRDNIIRKLFEEATK